ncbi:hypothetical protein M0R45_011611 [Rubus argutus]|uniref:Uncharacterized protein n=1 Tax=Rubus argutus TaxID=59490 RepID=A0AAW1YAK4_RUBAR
MKSIVASALMYGPDFGIPEFMAAGITAGFIMLILGVTGLMQLAYKVVPLSVVSGIQLAQGLSFAMSAVKYIQKVQDFLKAKSRKDRHCIDLDGLSYKKRLSNIMALLPTAFMNFVLGLILAFKRRPEVVMDITLGPSSIYSSSEAI